MAQFILNTISVKYDGDGQMPLMWYLRDLKGLTGTKFGCGKGLCGACTVQVNGVAVRSCQTSMASLPPGAQVTTIEGLSGEIGIKLKAAWAEYNVPQCGYCQAGQLMQASALLAHNPKPTDSEVSAAMQGNLCRCGTYQRIKKAIHRAAGGQS